MTKLFTTLLFVALSFSNSFAQRKTPSTHKKTVSIKYSEERAMELLRDYYSFYNKNYIYQNEEFRRISNNVFYISLEERRKESDDLTFSGKFFSSTEDHTFFWHARVLVLTINSSTKYTMKEKF